MANASVSSLILTYLKKQQTGTSFTVREMMGIVVPYSASEVSQGAVSGFLSKACSAGALTAVQDTDKATNRPVLRYMLADPLKLNALKVRNTAGAGSVAGRGDGSHKRAPFTLSRESLKDQLMNLAVEVEKMVIPLSSFSTEELLNELVRRQREQSK